MNVQADLDLSSSSGRPRPNPAVWLHRQPDTHAHANEAVYCLYQGVGPRENIDTVMRLGANHPMGPLALADLIGLDTCLAIMETLFNGFCDSKYRPCPLLRKYVEAGWLGRKTGRGFYEYSTNMKTTNEPC
jgi:3-hydroxyacyl-CoA dehydrogenase